MHAAQPTIRPFARWRSAHREHFLRSAGVTPTVVQSGLEHVERVSLKDAAGALPEPSPREDAGRWFG